MSKMNNNSRKSSKNTSSKSSKAKRTSKKNFKIENLEPRLMMDAATGFEVEKLDAYADQFESLSTTIADEVSNAIGSVENFDISSLGISEKIDSVTSLLSDSAESFKAKIVDNVKTVLTKAIENAKSEIEEAQTTVTEKINEISLSKFVNKYVKDFLNSVDDESYKGLTFEAEGSKLTISLDLSNKKSFENMGFNLGSLGELSLEGVANLTSVAKVKMSIDLNANGDESFLEDSSDIKANTPVIEKLETTIQNLGLKAKFMNMELKEINDTTEINADLSLSYNGTTVTNNIDLEFELNGADSLPFGFAEDEYIKISNRNGSLDVSMPEIQVKDSYSLSGLLESLNGLDIPFVGTAGFLGTDASAIANTIAQLNDCWGIVIASLQNAIEEVEKESGEALNKIKLNAEKFASSFQKMASSKFESLKKILTDLELQISDVNSINLFELLSGITIADIELPSNEANFALKLSPNFESLNSVKIGGETISGLAITSEIVVTFAAKYENSALSFDAPAFDCFSVKSNLSSVENSNLPFGISGDLILSVKQNNGDFVWTTVVPEFKMNEKFALDYVLDNLKNLNVPFLDDNFDVIELVKQFNDAWGNIAVSLREAVENVGDKVQLNAEKFANSLRNLASSKLDSLKKILTSFKLEVPGGEMVDILAIIAGDNNLGNIILPSDKLNFSLELTPILEGLNKASVGGVTFENLELFSNFVVNIAAKYSDGSLNFDSLTFGEFSISVKLDDKLSKELPFTVEGEVKITAGKNESGKLVWKTEIPEFKMKEELSLETIFDSFTKDKIPFLTNLTFELDGKSYLITDIANQINDSWSFVTGSLVNSIEDCKINLDTLKTTLAKAFADKYTDASNFISSIMISSSDLADNVESRLDIYNAIGNLSKAGRSINNYIDLKVDESNCLTLFFEPVELTKLLSVGEFDLKGVSTSMMVAVDIVIDVNENNEIVFEGISLRKVDFSFEKNGVTDVTFGGIGFSLENGKFTFNTSVTGDFERTATNASFEYSSLTLKTGSAGSFGLNEGAIRYINGNWEYPTEFDDLASLFSEKSFSVSSVLKVAKDIPLINNISLPYGDGDQKYTIGEVAEKIDSVWESVTAAIHGTVSKVDAATQKFTLNLQTLKNNFDKYIGSSKESVENILASLEFGGVNLLENIDSVKPKSINLFFGDNEIDLCFTTKSSSLKNFLNIGEGLDTSVEIKISVKLHVYVDENADVSFTGVSLENFEFLLNVPENNFISNEKISIEFAEQKGWNCTSIQFKSEISAEFIEGILNSIDLASIPVLNDCSLKLQGVEYSLATILMNLKDAFQGVSSAIESVDSKLKLNAKKFEAVFNNLNNLGNEKLQQILSSISVVNDKINSIENAVNSKLLFVNGKAENIGDLEGATFTFILSTQTAYLLENFDVLPFELQNVGVNVFLAIEVSLENGKISLKFKEISLNADIAKNLPSGLPISVENGSVKISYTAVGSWSTTIPSFKFNSDALSLSSLSSIVESANIPFFKDTSIFDVLKKIDSTWTYASAALYNAFECAENITVMKLDALQNDFKKMAGTAADSLLEELNVTSIISLDASSSINKKIDCNLLGNGFAEQNIDLVDGEYNLTLEFIPKVSLGDEINFGLFKLSGLTANVSVLINVKISISNGKVKFKGVELNEFSLKVEKTFEEDESIAMNLNGIDVSSKFNGGFSCDLIFNNKGLSTEKSSIKLSYTEASINVGDLEIAKIANSGVISYDFEGSWEGLDSLEVKSIFDKDFSLSSVLKFAEGTNIPFIGDSLTIGGVEYTISNLVGMVDSRWDKISNAMNFCLNESQTLEGIYLFDISKLQKLFGSLLGDDTESLKNVFGNIYVQKLSNVSLVDDEVDIEPVYDLLASISNDKIISLASNDSLILEFTQTTDEIPLDFYSYRLGDVQIGVSIQLKIKIVPTEDGAFSLQVGFDHFVLCVENDSIATMTEDFPYSIDGGRLEIRVSKDGVSTNVKENENFSVANLISNVKITEVLQKLLDLDNVPFLNSLKNYEISLGSQKLTLGDTIDSVSEYWSLLTSRMKFVESNNGGFSLNFDSVRQSLSSVISGASTKLLKDLKVNVDAAGNYEDADYINLIATEAVNKELQVKKGEEKSVLLAITTDDLDLAKTLNIGFLDLKKLKVNVTFYLEVTFVGAENGVTINNVSLKNFVISSELGTKSNPLNIGLFNALLEDGEFIFEIDANGESSINIAYKSLELKYDNVSLYKSPAVEANKKEAINYNITQSEWTFPSEISRFTSLSSATLVNQIYTVLNTLQTALRGLVEKKTQFDFLDGSIDKIVDISEKIERFIYGDSEYEGLLTYQNGSYVCELNLQELVNKINDIWAKRFKIDPESLVDSTGEKRDILDVTYDSKSNSLDLKFFLAFSIEKELGLNFTKLLSNEYNQNVSEDSKKSGMANVVTSGYVAASGLAGMDFSIRLAFNEKKSLDDKLKIKDIDVAYETGNALENTSSAPANSSSTSTTETKTNSSSKLTEEQQYYEFELTSNNTFENDITIAVRNYGDDIGYAKIVIKAGKDIQPGESGSWCEITPDSDNQNVNVCLTHSNQLCITAKSDFILKSPTLLFGDYYKAKLSNSYTQTTSVIKISNSNKKLNLYVAEAKEEKLTGKVINLCIDLSTIENLVNQQIILATNWKDRINEYLSLQKSEKNNQIDVPEVDFGMSIMNTFGLYVVDVDEQNGVLKSIRFGCDPTKLPNYAITEDKLVEDEFYLCDPNGTDITYMVLSGELTFDKKLSSTKVRVAYIYEKNGSDESCKIVELPWFESDNEDDIKKELETFKTENISVLGDGLEASYRLSENLRSLEIYIKPKSDNSNYTVKISNSVLKISVKYKEQNENGNVVDVDKTLFVDTSKCSGIDELVRAIESSIKQQKMGSTIFSVKNVDGKLVFDTKTGTVIEIIDNDILTPVKYEEPTQDTAGVTEVQTVYADFLISAVVNGANVVECVDFQKYIDKKQNGEESLLSVINKINNDLKFFEIYYGESGKNLDHFEIRFKDDTNAAISFSLKNLGSSEVLQKLGFTATQSCANGQKTSDGKNVQSIVGSSMLGNDWSNLIKLDDAAINLFANIELSLGVNVKASYVTTSDSRVTFKMTDEKSAGRTYEKGGFFEIGGDKYEILDVYKSNNDTYVVISSESIEKQTYKYDPLAKIAYVASASATLGFLGVDVVASGDLGLKAQFDLKKAESPEDNDILGFKVSYGLDLLDNPKIENVENNQITFDAYARLGELSTKLFGGKVCIAAENGSYKFDSDVNFDALDNLNELADQFKNFSVEQLFSVLESLIDKIGEITKNYENTKIPLINKSVGDLVNIANDLRDMVKKLRSEKITSIQHFEELINTYLEKFNLVAKGSSDSKLFSLTYDSDMRAIGFTFNVLKNFETSHQFNIGSASNSINGNVNLSVGGNFWLNLSATLSFGNEISLKLNDAIKFGAEINISGDNLSFALGINNNDSSLLSNLISVGSDKQKAFIYGSVGMYGTFGEKGTSVSKLNVDSLNACIPVAIYGKLPISVCNMSLGDVLIGWYADGSIDSASMGTSLEECKKTIDELVSNYLTSSVTTQAKGLYVLKPTENNSSFGFNLKLGTESDADLNNMNNSFVADFSQVYDRIKELSDFTNMDWFDQIKLAVAGLNNLFDMLETKLNNGMADSIRSVPVVGSALSSGVDILSVLKNKVLDPFSKFVYETSGMSVEIVAKKMNELLSSYFLSTTGKSNNGYTFEWESGEWLRAFIGNENDGKGSWYRTTNDSAEWFFNLGGVYSYGTDIAFDLGLPGLGLESNMGLNLSLTWNLEFGFGISKDNGFYFIFGDGDEISIHVDAGLDGSIDGYLAGLGLNLDIEKADVNLFFGVDLNNPDGEGDYSAKNRFDKNEQEERRDYGLVALSKAFSNIQFDYDASVEINAGITVGFGKDVVSKNNDEIDDTPKFPNITGDFVFEWGRIGESTSYDVKQLAFNDLKFDMGSFISGVLGPIVSKIQSVVEPLESLIDFLTTPFPVLDDLGIKMTPLDLAKQYSKGRFDDSMIYAIKDLISMSKTITNFTKNGGSLAIDLGNFVLVSGKANDQISFVKGQSSASSISDGDLKKMATNLDDESSITANASEKLGNSGLDENDSNWSFIWQHPSDIFKYLLGQDVDLVTYNMPALCFDFDWSTFVRIWGPLGARLGVTFSASIQLSFGYDTLGIRQWIASDCKDYASLLNGFYVNDLDENGYDRNELSFYGGLTASAELNAGVSAGIGGGVGIDVGFNLYDPNKDGKVRLNEIVNTVKYDGLFGLFDVNGKITAKLYAYVDLLFYTKKWNITGDKTLFSFDYTHSAIPVMATKDNQGNVIASVGANAGNRISTDGANATLTDGDEKLNLEIDGKTIYWADGDRSLVVDGGKKLVIDAGAGSDTITLTGSADFDIEIYGGDGDDVIDLSGLKVNEGHAVIIWGGSGIDTITGADGLNIIFGDAGVARIDKEEKDETGKIIKNRKYVIEANVDAGVAGDDIILGGSKRDIIIGGAGNDKIDGGEGDDIILGDGGKIEIDIVDDDTFVAKTDPEIEYKYENVFEYVSAVDIDLGKETPDVTISRTDISTDGGDDILVGGAGDDFIYGGSGSDHIDGGADNDVIYGERGNDYILGGSGDDEIHGGEGMDIILGDRLEGGSLNVKEPFGDNAFSEEFSETFFQDSSVLHAEQFKASEQKPSNDSGSAGVDHIYGDDGDDLIFGDSGEKGGANDYIEGGMGNDVIDGDGGDDHILGGIGNDVIYGGDGNDFIDGGAGNDSLYGDEGINGYDRYKKKYAQKEVIFGENLGLLNGIYSDIHSKTDGTAETGDDTIVTGPGMDFVDGQGGNDQVSVSFMGGSETSYANVIDSGDTSEINSLTIEGTEYADTLLMRMNNSKDFGFVALLPEDSSSTGELTNDNIERVNFNGNVKIVNLNANGGDDKIYIDGTAETTNVDGGSGNDSFQVGQLYNSVRNGKQSVVAIDRFNTIQTTDDDMYLSDGVTENSTLNIEGGAGDDSFTALHNVGDLNLSGGIGNDNFSIHSYESQVKEADGSITTSAIVNGGISIDGGRGVDSMTVNGTNGDDIVVVTKDGMLSEAVAVKAEGVESTSFNAAAGDDKFYVVSNNKGETTTINGGHGNDTVSIGGYEGENTLRSAETDGHKNTVTYEIVSSNLDDDKYSVGTKFIDSYSVVDTSTEPVVFVTKSDLRIDSSRLVVNEGGETSFYVSYSGDLKGGCIAVDLTAPMLSETARQNGDREVILESIDSANNIISGNIIRVFLTEACRSVKVTLKTFADCLSELDVVKSISINSYWGYYEGEIPKCEKLSKSSRSISLNIKDAGVDSLDDVPVSEKDKLLTRTEKFIVVAEGMQIGKGLKTENLYVYVEGLAAFAADAYSYDSATGILKMLSSEYNDMQLYVNYRSNTMQIEGSKIRLAYDNVGTIGEVKYNDQVIYSFDDTDNTHNSSVRYMLTGNTITFVDAISQKLVNLSGTISISNAAWLDEDLGITTESTEKTCDFLKFSAVGSSEISHTLAEMSAADDFTNWTSNVFAVQFAGTLAEGETVAVKVSVDKVVSHFKQEGDGNKHLNIAVVDSNGNYLVADADGAYTLCFTKNLENYTIGVVAIQDVDVEEYGVVKFSADGGKTISDVEGAVIAYGEGAGAESYIGDPQMLRYNHKIVDAKGNVARASQYDEKNNYNDTLIVTSISENVIRFKATDVAGRISKENEGGTIKIIQDKITSEWFRIEKYDVDGDFVVLTLNDSVVGFSGSNLSAIISVPRDYLFEDEADCTDRIFINNQDATNDSKSSLSAVKDSLNTEVKDSVRFNSEDLEDKNGIVANNFEYAEINLGSGKDTVDISKTLYREDGFQTFTVVNSGEGDDDITVKNYDDANDGQLVINAQEGDDTITAKSGVEKDGLIVFGGDGQDTIDVAKGVIAFGDKGSVSYGNKEATLGYDKDGVIIRAAVDAVGRENLQKETDGIVRAATSIKSVKDEEGAHDVITAGGEGSVIIGGFADDNITVTGERNVVLGDNGEVKFTDEGTAVTDWRENEKVVVSLKNVSTTSNTVGVKDTIKITGSSNVVMGGDGDDDITITGYDNVVLGDGGSAEFVNGGVSRENCVVNASIVSVKTEDDKEGEADDITITGENNTVMGGAGGDTITIGEQGNNESGCKNVVLGDGGSYTIDRENKEVTVKTSREQTDDETVLIYGGVDTIDIYGGKNTVMGGTKGDTINVYGGDNIVLGDGGVAVREWTEDGSIFDSIKYVETTDDNDGGVDEVEIEGSKNVAMGGNDGDIINISGSDNVAVGDGGRYEVHGGYLTVNTKSEKYGGQDTITTEDGKNVVLGGMEADKLTTGKGNDIILGDGGFVMLDEDHNALFVTNTDYNTDGDEAKTGGADVIETTGGDNVIMGGMESDQITSGDGNDVIFGDNAYATFRGNAGLINTTDEKYTDVQKNLEFEDYTEIRTESILSFNFQGSAQNGLNADEKAGIYNANHWNNIAGSLSGTYGNDDKELVYFNSENGENAVRASAISVSYGGIETHRNTATDNRINTQYYNHNLNGNTANNKLMTSGIMTTAPNDVMGNVMEVAVDGLSQYYESYEVVVYLDVPDSHSAADQSIRKVTLTYTDKDGMACELVYYVDDKAGDNFNGEFVKSTFTSADAIVTIDESNKRLLAKQQELRIKQGNGIALSSDELATLNKVPESTYGNYVVFEVEKRYASDRFVVTIEDGYTADNKNGKDLPGIAGLQIKGVHHKQDVAASTNIDKGGEDFVFSKGGDDIIVGGTGNDEIVSYGDERYGLYDNDVVFGDNAKLLFEDRDSDDTTATTLTRAESIAATNMNATYDDVISTGDGNDVVVGGIGADKIFSGDVKNVTISGKEFKEPEHETVSKKNSKLDGIEALGFNFTGKDVNASGRVDADDVTGVVESGNWHNVYRNDRGFIVAEDNVPLKPIQPTYPAWTGSNETFQIVLQEYYAALDEYTKALQKYNEAMKDYNNNLNSLGQNQSTPNQYSVVDGVGVGLYAVENGNVSSTAAMKILDDESLDGDTSNSKLYNSYIAAQQSDELILKLTGLQQYCKQGSCDVYIYIGGGDKDSSGAYNYVYKVSADKDSARGYQGETRYLNDWRGNNFEGDYREATCTDSAVVADALREGITPDVTLIGNYVVLRNVTADDLTVHLLSLYVQGSLQSPKHLPVISAVQIVVNTPNENNVVKSASEEIAIGGDHDKDLVFGDDAYLEFDLDIPFAVNENLTDYDNRVITANSVAISKEDATQIDTRDIIVTGKDRDVVVGGEGADVIRSGAADDVVLGDNAALKLEHNNPIGVFTPSVENTLEEHTYKQSDEKYLGHDNVTVQDIERKYNNGAQNQQWNNNDNNRIIGITDTTPTNNTTGRKDDIVDTEGSNLLIEGSYDNSELYVPKQEETQKHPSIEPDEPIVEPDEDVDQPETNDPVINEGDENEPEVTPGETEGDDDVVSVRTETITTKPQMIQVTAGETIKISCYEYPQGDQWWTPNVVLYGNNASASQIPSIKWIIDGKEYTSASGNSIKVDLPDHPNAGDHYEFELVATADGVLFLYVDQG